MYLDATTLLALLYTYWRDEGIDKAIIDRYDTSSELCTQQLKILLKGCGSHIIRYSSLSIRGIKIYKRNVCHVHFNHVSTTCTCNVTDTRGGATDVNISVTICSCFCHFKLVTVARHHIFEAKINGYYAKK